MLLAVTDGEQLCGICQRPVEARQDPTRCMTCGAAYHRPCRQTKGRCVQEGCAAARPRDPARAIEPPKQKGFFEQDVTEYLQGSRGVGGAGGRSPCCTIVVVAVLLGALLGKALFGVDLAEQGERFWQPPPSRRR